LQSKAAKRRDDAQRLIKTPNKPAAAPLNTASKANGFTVINDSRAKLDRNSRAIGEQMEMEVMTVDVVKSRQKHVRKTIIYRASICGRLADDQSTVEKKLSSLHNKIKVEKKSIYSLDSGSQCVVSAFA
jgi:hypothetical protein